MDNDERPFDRRLARLDDIERRLAQTPNGLTTGQLARHYRVDPSTIYRDFSLLESRGAGLFQDKRRWYLDHRRALYSIKFTQHELVALYVAARLLVRYSDELNNHVSSLLAKLADVLRTRSPLVSDHISEAAIVAEEKPLHPDFIQAFETIGRGWIESRKIRFIYDSYNKNERTQRTFCPYFIEPTGIAFSLYVIGWDELRSAVRTFKLDRIHDAELLDERFDRPPASQLRDELSSAWGIWSDGESIKVVLRFTPRVARRIHESSWHPSQQIEDLPDGSCIFTAHIGSLVEFTPWVRQWGADVEVLGPPDLRASIIHDLETQLRTYAQTAPVRAT
jgi:predicted DNA-binding transcriptional regulator YafY